MHPLKSILPDPAAFGLFAFATTTFVASTHHTKWIENDNSFLFSVAFWYGGWAQVIAGLIDTLRGEKIGGSLFMAYGLYWITIGSFTVPFHQPLLVDNNPAVGNGFFLLAYSLMSLVYTVAMLTTTWLQFLLLSLVSIDFLCLSLLKLSPLANEPLFDQVVGYLLSATAALAFYVGSAKLLEGLFRWEIPLYPIKRFSSPERSMKYYAGVEV